MSNLLEAWIGVDVNVITVDGRVFVGVLKGFDQSANLIIANAVERVFSADAPVKHLPLGLYLLRGDNVSVHPPCLYAASPWAK